MSSKRTVKSTAKSTKQTKETKEISNESDSENEILMETKTPIQPIYLTSKSTLSNDNDRIQLAQAINNFTLKSDQLLQEMKNFDSFKENVFKLDLQIDSKKKEYAQTNENLELDFIAKKKAMENQYTELSKKLKIEYDEQSRKHTIDHADKVKKCESEFADKNKALTNAYEDESIQMRRKLELDKNKACVEYAKSLGHRFIKEEEHKTLTDNANKAINDYTELKKTFDKQCNQIREEEKVKYQNQLKNDTLTMDLTHKATNAAITAQVDQQKREIQVLCNTIENLKSELREQRELTKQVAQASAKSPIQQSFGKP